MGFIISEFKARVEDMASLEARLLELHPRFIGCDHQVDTYFNVPHGRLKWRKGNVENALIFYLRSNEASVRTSRVIMEPLQPGSALPELIRELYDVLVVVDKQRRIYRLDHVKFHLDKVAGLGLFAEVEVIDESGTGDEASLREQAEYFRNFLGIPEQAILSESYSDLLLR